MTGRDWSGGELRARDWRLAWPPGALDALLQLALAGNSQPPGIDSLRTFVGELRRRLRDGPGLVVVDGFPVTELDEDEISSALLTLGRCLGRPVSQDRSGTLVGRVEDAGAALSERTRRGHKSSAALPFHVDRTDVVGLLCVRASETGGESRAVSAAAVHRILAGIAPEALRVLYAELPEDRRGEERPGQPPWVGIPMFSRDGERLVTRYVPRFVEASQSLPEAPRLRREQRAALAAAEAAVHSPGLVLEHRLAPGELQLIDNYAVWHAREAFARSGARRLLLRLWLASPDSPRLPESFRPIYGATAPGVVRGGVWPPGTWPEDLGGRVRPMLDGALQRELVAPLFG